MGRGLFGRGCVCSFRPSHLDTCVVAKTFQDLILTLQIYWASKGCLVLQPYDDNMGAGTFHPATTLRALGPRKWNAAFVQPSRRPKDGRYGAHTNHARRTRQTNSPRSDQRKATKARTRTGCSTTTSTR